jgi:hypothetical protein
MDVSRINFSTLESEQKNKEYKDYHRSYKNTISSVQLSKLKKKNSLKVPTLNIKSLKTEGFCGFVSLLTFAEVNNLESSFSTAINLQLFASLQDSGSAESKRPTAKLHPADLSHQSEIITLRRPARGRLRFVIGKGRFLLTYPGDFSFAAPQSRCIPPRQHTKKPAERGSQLFSRL